MGYYTEVKCDLVLKKETPKKVVNLLRKIMVERDFSMGGRTSWSVGEEPRPDIDHPFADCPRWSTLLCSEIWGCKERSAFQENGKDGTFTLIIRGDLKNYDDEIELFSDWIKPCVDIEKTANPIVIWKGGEDEEWTEINLAE